ncbi:hypothetical protein IWQ62_002083 [Dispira parvispora]|uniref:Uncharacterized protein n=1 Tax=Dispira parvispora TaxID=1520584 RepID=A0A9W8AUL5_9FUNG|nr:hypothetical protein IWQ62_002083 [Dispira parvispora]
MTRLGYWRGCKELAVQYGPLVAVAELDPEAIDRITDTPEAYPTDSIPRLEQYTDRLVNDLTEHVQTLTTTKVSRIDLVYNMLRAAKDSFVTTATRPDKTKRPQDTPPSEFVRRKQTKFIRQWLGRYLDQKTLPSVTTQGVLVKQSSSEPTGNQPATDPALVDILTTLKQWQTLCDPTILLVQSKSRYILYPCTFGQQQTSVSIVEQTVCSLLRKYPTVPSGRTVARIFHGLPSPQVTALEWRGTGLWQKFHYIDFDVLRVLAHQTIVRIRCESESPTPVFDLSTDTETTT